MKKLKNFEHFIIFLISGLFLKILQTIYSYNKIPSLYFQTWPSDIMMGYIPVKTLREHPFWSIVYAHAKPPLPDIFRAFLAWLSPVSENPGLLHFVDYWTEMFYILLFASLCTLIFLIAKQLINSIFAWVVTIGFIFHPSPIFYSVLLEATFPGAVLVTWFFYELLRINRGATPRALRLGVIVCLMILTRSFFQIWFIGVLCLIAYLFQFKRREWLQFLILPILTFTLIVAKQRYYYQTYVTSTFLGEQGLEMFFIDLDYQRMDDIQKSIKINYPAAALEIQKGDLYNTPDRVLRNLSFAQYKNEWIRAHPKQAAWRILKNIKYNGIEQTYNRYSYWMPSWLYTPNRLTDPLPWKDLYFRVFHPRVYPLVFLFLIVCGAFLFLRNPVGRKERVRRILPLCFLPAYLLMVGHLCNRGFWTESNRMKFFHEPLYYVLSAYLIMQLFFLFRKKLIDRNWDFSRSET